MRLGGGSLLLSLGLDRLVELSLALSLGARLSGRGLLGLHRREDLHRQVGVDERHELIGLERNDLELVLGDPTRPTRANTPGRRRICGAAIRPYGAAVRHYGAAVRHYGGRRELSHPQRVPCREGRAPKHLGLQRGLDIGDVGGEGGEHGLDARKRARLEHGVPHVHRLCHGCWVARGHVPEA